jgi:hypothetical protein
MKPKAELSEESLRQNDWEMNPSSYRFPCYISKDVYLKLYLSDLKYKKTCADAKAIMYKEQINLLKSK